MIISASIYTNAYNTRWHFWCGMKSCSPVKMALQIEGEIMVKPEDIKKWIEQYLAQSEVKVSGDGRHFDAIIVCPAFYGKTRIQQHQMVYAALGDKMKEEVHALSMRTMTPEAWVKEETEHK